MDAKWIKAEELAKHLNVSVSFLCNNRKRAEKDKVIPYSLLGRKVMYNVDIVDEFVKNNLGHNCLSNI